MRNPFFEIKMGDEPVTQLVSQYLEKLTISDRAGGRSDALMIDLADTERFNIPRPGRVIGAAIGYRGGAYRDVQNFRIDQIGHEGPPAKIVVSATGADFSNEQSMRAPRERTHEPTTLANLLATLAQPYGVTSQVIPTELGETALPLVDQAGQSDLGLAVELAETYGGIFKPVDGQWVILGYAMIRTAAPAETFVPRDVTTWRAHFIARRAYPSVTAHYHDYGRAQRVPVTAGEGAPNKILNRTYATEATARAHAQAAWAKGQREARQLTLTMPGRPELVAHSKIALAGFRERVDGEWLITEVEHTLDTRGYRCRVTAEGL